MRYNESNVNVKERARTRECSVLPPASPELAVLCESPTTLPFPSSEAFVCLFSDTLDSTTQSSVVSLQRKRLIVSDALFVNRLVASDVPRGYIEAL